MLKLKQGKKTSLLATAHQMAKGLHKAGIIDSVTLREFDALCLPKIKELSSAEIKKIRLQQKVSQSVFAQYLNTSTSTIRQWEQGEKHPRGTSLKLLNLVDQKGLKILL